MTKSTTFSKKGPDVYLLTPGANLYVKAKTFKGESYYRVTHTEKQNSFGHAFSHIIAGPTSESNLHNLADNETVVEENVGSFIVGGVDMGKDSEIFTIYSGVEISIGNSVKAEKVDAKGILDAQKSGETYLIFGAEPQEKNFDNNANLGADEGQEL